MTHTSALAPAELTARGRYGLFTTADAIAAGLSAAMLHHHSRAGGRWRRVAPQVYEVRRQQPDWRRPLMAALLWGGAEAVLSHRSAAAVLDLDGAHRHGPPELYRPSGRPHPPWIVHRGAPPAASVMTTNRLRQTDGRQTLGDLSRVKNADQLELAVEAALRHVAYLDLCLPQLELFTELDGRWAHSRPTAVFVDRHRQNRVVKLLGWRPLRYAWDDVVERPVATARDVEDTCRRARSGAWAAR